MKQRIPRSLLLLLVLFLVSLKNASAQHPHLAWVQTAGGVAGGDDNVKASATDAEGNIYMIGDFTGRLNFGNGDVEGNYHQSFITKHNSAGTLQWVRILKGGVTSIYDLAVDNSGVYMTGYFNSSTNEAVDFNGEGTAAVNKVSVNGVNLFVAKYDRGSGDNQWVKAIASTHNQGAFFSSEAYGIAVNAAGVFITGKIRGNSDFDLESSQGNTSTSTESAFLAKYTQTSGALGWVKVFEGIGTGYDVVTDEANVYIAGHMYGGADFGPGEAGGVISVSGNRSGNFLAKFNAETGSNLWAKVASESASPSARHLLALSDGSLYLSADFENSIVFNLGATEVSKTSRRREDIFVSKHDTGTGDFQWVETITGTNRLATTDNSFTRRQQLVAHATGVALVGYFTGNSTFGEGPAGLTATSKGGSDLFVSYFLASNGRVERVKTIGGLGNERAASISFVENDIVLAGSFTGTANLSADGTPIPKMSVNGDIFLAKYTQGFASTIWTKHLVGGTGGSDRAHAMAKDAQGNIYLTGWMQGIATFGTVEAKRNGIFYGQSGYERTAYLAKYTAQGSLEWVKALGGSGKSEGYAIVVDAEAIYLTGYFEGEVDFNTGGTPVSRTSSKMVDGDSFYTNGFVAKYSRSTGENLWVKPVVGSTSSYSTGVSIYDGAVYVAGVYEGEADFNSGGPALMRTSQGLRDAFLLKLNAQNGSTQWLRTIGGTRYDEASALVVNGNGVFVTGSFDVTADFNIGGNAPVVKTTVNESGSLYVAAYGLDGESKWVQHASAGFSAGAAITAEEGAVYVTGTISSSTAVDFYTANNDHIRLQSDGWLDGFVAKFNAADGNAQWAKIMGGDAAVNTFTSGYGIAVDEGNVYVAGGFEATTDFNIPGFLKSGAKPTHTPVVKTNAGAEDAFLVKYSKDSGDLQWVKALGDTHHQAASAVLATASGIFLTGNFSGQVNFNEGGTASFIRTSQGVYSDIFLAKYENTLTSVKGEEGLAERQLSVYPNPTAGEFSIVANLGWKAGKYKARLVNVLGATVWQQNMSVTNKGRLDLKIHDVPAGTYVLVLESEAELLKKKITKI